MKIALIGLRLTIGPRLIVDTMGDALARAGHDVVFVGERHEPPSLRAISINDDASYLAMLRQTFSPAYYRSVVDVLVREKPDCCYFISVHPANGLLCKMIRARVRTAGGQPTRIAAHLHDPLPHPGAAWPLIFGAQQIMARLADRVVVYGRALQRQVSALYGIPARQVIVVRHGASRSPREVPPEAAVPTHFSFLGRIAAYKGLEIFLDAARRLHATYPELRFYVGGAGSIAPYRRALADLGSAVTVYNRDLTNDETDAVMQSSWAVVLPYTSGTQSGVIPVAYWNGSPVITTDVGALPETVIEGETGFVVPPADPAALAERMEQLWRNPGLRARMGRAGFQHYLRFFRWEFIADQLIRAFDDRAPLREVEQPAEILELERAAGQ